MDVVTQGMFGRSDYAAVVRVFATTQAPDYDNPWQSMRPSHSTGSGVVVGPGQILTGAHVVANATFIQVQRVAQPDKITAAVVAICHDADLALLSVDDADFVADVVPEALGELPNLQDRVSVVGFPIGGEEISITAGVVSRIEVQRYSHSQRRLLAVTVDAAINSGNSGGPVYKDGRVIGIAFQSLSNAENIGELVPANLIRRFLDGVEQRRDIVMPGIGLVTQGLENPSLRRHLGMQSGESGVRVTAVDHGTSAWGHIEVGDVLLSISGLPIANNGTVRYRSRYRTFYTVVLGDFYVGDTIQIDVLRQGQHKTIMMPLRPVKHLVPAKQYDRAPRFFIYGGLVFQPLSLDYLQTWSQWRTNAPLELVYNFFFEKRAVERQEVIVLTQILADQLNIGFEQLTMEVVVSLNGQSLCDLKSLVDGLRAAEGMVELEMSSGRILVLDADIVDEANQRILRRYRIPEPGCRLE